MHHLDEFVAGLLDFVAASVIVVDEVVESVIHAVERHLLLSLDAQRVVLKSGILNSWELILYALLHSGCALIVAARHTHDLIRNNVHLLQRQRLHLGTGEATDNPALLNFLIVLNLFLDNFTNDFVVD